MSDISLPRVSSALLSDVLSNDFPQEIADRRLIVEGDSNAVLHALGEKEIFWKFFLAHGISEINGLEINLSGVRFDYGH
jgi:hypothetical protein